MSAIDFRFQIAAASDRIRLYRSRYIDHEPLTSAEIYLSHLIGIRMHIENAKKKQKSFGASINIKPRASVFPLRAKIWDALDKGCSC